MPTPDRHITVLYINHYVEIGGGESALYNLLKGLDRSRVTPVMMFNRRGPFVEAVEAIGVKTVILPYPTVMIKRLILPNVTWQCWKASLTIHRYLRANPVDVIQCADVLTLILLLRHLITQKTPIVFNVIFFYEWTRMILFNLLALLFVRRIVTDSMAVRDDLRRRTLLLGKKIVHIYKAIDPTPFERPSVNGVSKFRRELAVTEGKKLVGMVGRFDTWKGHKTFLEAASYLSQLRKDLRFVIVGGLLNADVLPPLRRYYNEVLRLRHELRLESAVPIVPHRSDMPEVLRGLDVLVCPSFREPIPMIILEAMASGVPVVASDSGGNVEQIDDGKDGFLFHTGDMISLARTISRCLESPSLPHVTAQARRRLETQFGLKRYAREMEQLYGQIVAQPLPSRAGGEGKQTSMSTLTLFQLLGYKHGKRK